MQISMARFTSRPRNIIALVAAAALVLSGAVAFGVAGASAAAATTIWGDRKPVGVRLDADPSAAELGTTFTPSVAGVATAIRFYKVSGETGVHTGSIWSADGTRIANVTFDNETASGWQSATLSKPVSLKAGAPYVVSYRVPAGGRYATTVEYSGKSKSAILKVRHRDSGVYTYSPSGSHPRSTWRSSQYWADLIAARAPPRRATARRAEREAGGR